METRHSPALWGIAAVWLTLILAAGCEDDRRRKAPATQPATLAAAASLTEPLEVGKAFITALRDAQRVRASGLTTRDQRVAYHEAMARVASFAGSKQIHQTLLSLRSPLVPVGISEQEAVRRVSESWVSMAAYYAEGFQYDSLRVLTAPTESGLGVDLYVEAERPEDRIRLVASESSPPGGSSLGVGQAPEQAGSSLDGLRAMSLAAAPAFNTPISASFRIHLQQVDGVWLATRLDIGPTTPVRTSPPPRQVPEEPSPTTLPQP